MQVKDRIGIINNYQLLITNYKSTSYASEQVDRNFTLLFSSFGRHCLSWKQLNNNLAKFCSRTDQRLVTIIDKKKT